MSQVDYKFPSKIEVDPSAVETCLRRKKKIPLDLIDWFLLSLLVVSLTVLLFITERIVIDPMLNSINHAEASYDDSHYCAGIEEGRYTVLGASTEEVLEYCEKYGN